MIRELKKHLAEALDNAILKDVNSRKWTLTARRQAVAHACAVHDVSERRTCLALDLDGHAIRYRLRRPADADVGQRIRELANGRRRPSYRRLHFLLGNEGLVMNQKQFRRLYREDRLAVTKRGGRRRTLGEWAPFRVPEQPN